MLSEAQTRTRLALDRTLMAWIRTAAALIALGFGLDKAFELLSPAARPGILGPRGFSLVLIGSGLLGLLLATIQHDREMKRSWVQSGARPTFSITSLMAGLFLLVGAVALIAVVVGS